MASLKIKEIRTLTKADLDSKLDEARKELIKLNAQAAVGTTLQNPRQLKSLKKTISRLMTVIKEKENSKK